MHDLVIVGGGPAGVAAGVYAARKKIKTVLITDYFGGQSLVSADIQNWVGIKSISGYDLGRQLEEHLRAQEGIEVIGDDLVLKIGLVTPAGFRVETRNGKILEAKTVLITAGSRRKKLGVPGEKEFDGKGVAYCSTCDAPLFKDKEVVVVGGGNAGLEAVLDLIPYASKIYLLERTAGLRGDPATREKIISNPKVTVILNAETREFSGDKMLSKMIYKDLKSGEAKKLAVQGVFVEIGSRPNAEMAAGLVSLNNFGEIIVDHKTQKTSCEGIWAAGDVTDVLYKQNNISMGDAVKAVLNIYEYLNKNS